MAIEPALSNLSLIVGLIGAIFGPLITGLVFIHNTRKLIEIERVQREEQYRRFNETLKEYKVQQDDVHREYKEDKKQYAAERQRLSKELGVLSNTLTRLDTTINIWREGKH